VLPHSLAVLQLAAHIPQEEGMLVAGIPGHCNLAVHQVEHSQDVAGNPYVLWLAGSFQVAEDNQNPVGQLHMVGDIQVVQFVGNLSVDTYWLLLSCSRPTNVPRTPCFQETPRSCTIW